MKYIILKFGGSSLTKFGFNVIIEQINKRLCESYKVIIVLSAIKNTTNNLIKIANMVNKEHIKKIYKNIYNNHINLCNELNLNINIDNIFEDLLKCINDDKDLLIHKKIKIISYGEILSTNIFYQYATNTHDTQLLNASEFIKCSVNSDKIDVNNFTVDGTFYCDSDKIKCLTKNNKLTITQGFIASTTDDKICILTRSGSDTSASLIGSAVDADIVEIWTDVDGIYTADPNMISSAKLIKNISYDVCQELSAMGASIIHPYCIKPCQEKNIPIHIHNTYNFDLEHSVIDNKFDLDNINKIYSITNQKNVTTFNIQTLDMWNNYGFVHDIFNVFAKFKVNINIITTSQFLITTTTDEISVAKLIHTKEELEKKYKVNMISNCNIISIVADNILKHKKMKKSFDIINSFPFDKLYVTHFSSNNMSLSFVVDNVISNKLTHSLHDQLI